MATRAARPTRDPEFDPPLLPAAPPGPYDDLFASSFSPPEDYQRLLGNPFLALLWLIVWFELMERVLTARLPSLFLPTLASLAAFPFLLQFHCLDCGATGRLKHWRDHACSIVKARQEARKVRRWGGPTPGTQSVLWFLGVVVVWFFAAVLWR